MPEPLRLTLTDYEDATRWRWVLSDARGSYLADHSVRLDPTSSEHRGFVDLRGYLQFNAPIRAPAELLEDLGEWIGAEVFGGLREALWSRRALPAVAVHVAVPKEAQELLLRPFELARFDASQGGKSFRAEGVRFVYQLAGDAGAGEQQPRSKDRASALRILAAFSLPESANPLDLRRERVGLQRLVRELSRMKGLG